MRSNCVETACYVKVLCTPTSLFLLRRATDLVGCCNRDLVRMIWLPKEPNRKEWHKMHGYDCGWLLKAAILWHACKRRPG